MLTGIRVCPHCHTPTSSAFGSAPTRLISVIGGPAAGKTVFLQMLTKELVTSAPLWFDADIQLSTLDGRVSSAVGGSILADGMLPAHTARTIVGRQHPTVIEWRREYRMAGLLQRHRTTHLSFYDTPGEDVATLNEVRDQEYIDVADALILVLDPLMIEQIRASADTASLWLRPESTAHLIGRVIEHLRASLGIRGERLIDLPVAVVVTKFDELFGMAGMAHPLLYPPPLGVYNDRAGLETHWQVKAFLQEYNAGDIDSRLRMNFSNYRYFAVSALGAAPDHNTGQVNPSGVHPFRVLEPMVWLLKLFGIAPE